MLVPVENIPMDVRFFSFQFQKDWTYTSSLAAGGEYTYKETDKQFTREQSIKKKGNVYMYEFPNWNNRYGFPNNNVSHLLET